MTLSIDQLRAAFKKEESTQSRPNNYYPFWNMQVGEQAIVRFLPDKDQDNHLGFMVEKMMHTLNINGENKSVPCLKMYGEDCPICRVSSAYYKDEGKGSANGKKYWRKKQHLVQALIVEDPLPADKETGETTRVSLTTDGSQGEYASSYPSISADGRFVSFQSSSNLDPKDTNVYMDIYVHDRLTKETKLVSISTDERQTNRACSNPQFRVMGDS